MNELIPNKVYRYYDNDGVFCYRVVSGLCSSLESFSKFSGTGSVGYFIESLNRDIRYFVHQNFISKGCRIQNESILCPEQQFEDDLKDLIDET